MIQDVPPPINTARLTDAFGEDDEFQAEMYALYVADTRKRIEDLNQALSDRDRKSFKQATHTLKGSSANIGAVRMFQVADALEQLCPDQDFDQAARRAEELSAEFEAVKQFVQAHHGPMA